MARSSRHRAGTLDQRLELQAWDGTETARGAPDYSEPHWRVTATLWAEVLPLQGFEIEKARQLVAEATYQVTVRRYSSSSHTPTNVKRFRHKQDGRVFYVGHVANVAEDQSKLVCICGNTPS